MEKKTKLRITSALAVLVIALSVGTAIASIATNDNDAQTPALVQSSTETSCLLTARGTLWVSSPQTIYESIYQNPPAMLTTITCTHGRMEVRVISDGGVYDHVCSYGNSVTIYGRPTKIIVSGKGTSGNYELVGAINPEPPP